MAKKWIQDAIKKPGSLTAAAKRAGKSIAEHCKAPPSTKAKQRCNLAKTLRKIAKKRKKKACGGSVMFCGGEYHSPVKQAVGPNKIL